jgi:hypothetical protein
MTFSRPYISNIEIKFPFSTYTFKKLYGGRVSENIFSCYVIARDMRSITLANCRTAPEYTGENVCIERNREKHSQASMRFLNKTIKIHSVCYL